MSPRFLLAAVLVFHAAAINAAVGMTQIAGLQGDGKVTIFYPSSSEERPVRQGPFTLLAARNGEPQRGNGRLVVISHGMGSVPWVHADLARALVEDGFVVALPTHRGDNYTDPGTPGPESWKRRPLEVTRAIDAVDGDARFAPLLKLDQVGMYGYSAGGHAALTLAGGRWSPATFAQHCESHIADDFRLCVGLAPSLRGDSTDGPRKARALKAIEDLFSDATWQVHTDPRIAAIVAACPVAADFDMASLARPRVPLALVTAPRDQWLIPRFHAERVLQACPSCKRLAEIPNGGHGASMSPLPPGMTGIAGDLLNDPPGFDRSVLPAIDRRIVEYFHKHLVV